MTTKCTPLTRSPLSKKDRIHSGSPWSAIVIGVSPLAAVLFRMLSAVSCHVTFFMTVAFPPHRCFQSFYRFFFSMCAFAEAYNPLVFPVISRSPWERPSSPYGLRIFTLRRPPRPPPVLRKRRRGNISAEKWTWDQMWHPEVPLHVLPWCLLSVLRQAWLNRGDRLRLSGCICRESLRLTLRLEPQKGWVVNRCYLCTRCFFVYFHCMAVMTFLLISIKLRTVWKPKVNGGKKKQTLPQKLEFAVFLLIE